MNIPPSGPRSPIVRTGSGVVARPLSPLARSVNPISLGLDVNRTSFSRTNALGLAHFSNAAYDPEDQISAQFASRGLTGLKMFSNLGAQGLVASSEHVVVAALRGTESLGDVISNLNALQVPRFAGDAKVHMGFNSELNNIWPGMKETILELVSAKKRPVFLTGHSLGGAMATIGALDLANTGLRSTLYTYGSPRVGNDTFAEQFEAALGSRHFRVVNGADAVTKLPALLDWEHVGQLIYLGRNGNLETDSTLFGRLWDRGLSRLTNPVAGVSTHRILDYIAKLARQ